MAHGETTSTHAGREKRHRPWAWCPMEGASAQNPKSLTSHSCRSAVDAEAHRPSGDGQLMVMGGEREIVELVPHEEGACEMDGVERPEDRRERLGRSLEDRGDDRNKAGGPAPPPTSPPPTGHSPLP